MKTVGGAEKIDNYNGARRIDCNSTQRVLSEPGLTKEGWAEALSMILEEHELDQAQGDNTLSKKLRNMENKDGKKNARTTTRRGEKSQTRLSGGSRRKGETREAMTKNGGGDNRRTGKLRTVSATPRENRSQKMTIHLRMDGDPLSGRRVSLKNERTTENKNLLYKGDMMCKHARGNCKDQRSNKKKKFGVYEERCVWKKSPLRDSTSDWKETEKKETGWEILQEEKRGGGHVIAPSRGVEVRIRLRERILVKKKRGKLGDQDGVEGGAFSRLSCYKWALTAAAQFQEKCRGEEIVPWLNHPKKGNTIEIERIPAYHSFGRSEFEGLWTKTSEKWRELTGNQGRLLVFAKNKH